jgi:hypothetical protein
MKRKIFYILAVALILTGCTTTTVIGPYADFFRPDRCEGWPAKADHIGANGEVTPSYVLRGYQAYRCERDTRIAAGEALKRLS